MNRACALLLGVACLGLPSIRGEDSPNIILILTDDQGWGDARFAGHPYVQTPNIDRLAAEGTWFKQFYVASPVCSPSRCAFMTSHFPARHRIHGHFASHAVNAARHMPDWLDPTTPTVTSLLKRAGYATGHFGKWHLGGGDDAPTPEAYGIDDVRAMVCRNPAWSEPPETFWAKSSAAIVDETIRFIKANKGRPFYANVWTLLPHAPLRPTSEQRAVYASLEPRADAPPFGPWMRKYAGAAKDLESQMQVFCASLTDLDTQVGLRPAFTSCRSACPDRRPGSGRSSRRPRPAASRGVAGAGRLPALAQFSAGSGSPTDQPPD